MRAVALQGDKGCQEQGLQAFRSAKSRMHNGNPNIAPLLAEAALLFNMNQVMGALEPVGVMDALEGTAWTSH